MLYVTNNLFGRDGWGKYSRNLIQPPVSDIDKVVLVQKTDNSCAVRQIPIMRYPTLYYAYPIFLFLDFLRLTKVIRREKPDIIHILVEPYALFVPFLFGLSAPIVLTVHGTYAIVPLKKRLTRWLAKIYYRRITLIISVSEYTKAQLLSVCSFVSDKMVVVHNSVTVQVSTPSVRKDSVPIIMSIGGVKERKGILESILAVAKYRDMYGSNFHYYIVGEYLPQDPYVAKVIVSIKKHGLEDSVSLLGFISEDEKNKLLMCSSVFILLSKHTHYDHFEGFGLVYIEANSFGIPTIGPNTSGAAEAIWHGRSGYRVDIYDTTVIAEKLHDILSRQSITREDCLLWAKKHDIVQMNRKIFDEYRRILSN